MSNLELPFTRGDLNDYLTLRTAGLADKSITWLNKSAELLWNAARGVVSVSTMWCLRDLTLTKYQDRDAKRKVLGFARAFLRYMARVNFDQRYVSFELFLQLPMAVKEQKRVTERIITKEDVESLLRAIRQAYQRGEINTYRYRNYTALVLFGAFTGQRPLATIARLTIGQLREAVKMENPVVDVLPSQDKIRMQHYVPVHPQVADAILPMLDERDSDERAFKQLSFQQWLRYNEVRLKHGGGRIVNGDLRKFTEQQGDIIGWEQSNCAYVLTHGVSGVDWRHYKRPLPEYVYQIYVKYWGDVRFESS